MKHVQAELCCLKGAKRKLITNSFTLMRFHCCFNNLRDERENFIKDFSVYAEAHRK